MSSLALTEGPAVGWYTVLLVKLGFFAEVSPREFIPFDWGHTVPIGDGGRQGAIPPCNGRNGPFKPWVRVTGEGGE
jgi:hypothetical protein